MSDEYNPFQNATAAEAKKASVAVYEQIREKILSGELQPGDKLPPERELIQMFQRSRPTVREALRMLGNKNYVTIHRGKGVFVSSPSTDEVERILASLLRLNLVSVKNVMDVRDVCENVAVRLAAENRSEQDILVMKGIYAESERVRDDFFQHMACGIRLNGAIAKAAHNEMLYLVIRLTSKFLHDQLAAQCAELPKEEKDRLTTLNAQQHKALLDAIYSGDAERAVQLNREHIQSVAKTIFELK